MDVIVGLRRLVASPASAVEGFARVDARGRRVAAILAADGIASPAFWRRRGICEGQSGRCEDGQGGEMHCQIEIDRE